MGGWRGKKWTMGHHNSPGTGTGTGNTLLRLQRHMMCSTKSERNEYLSMDLFPACPSIIRIPKRLEAASGAPSRERHKIKKEEEKGKDLGASRCEWELPNKKKKRHNAQKKGKSPVESVLGDHSLHRTMQDQPKSQRHCHGHKKKKTVEYIVGERKRIHREEKDKVG